MFKIFITSIIIIIQTIYNIFTQNKAALFFFKGKLKKKSLSFFSLPFLTEYKVNAKLTYSLKSFFLVREKMNMDMHQHKNFEKEKKH